MHMCSNKCSYKSCYYYCKCVNRTENESRITRTVSITFRTLFYGLCCDVRFHCAAPRWCSVGRGHAACVTRTHTYRQLHLYAKLTVPTTAGEHSDRDVNGAEQPVQRECYARISVHVIRGDGGSVGSALVCVHT